MLSSLPAEIVTLILSHLSKQDLGQCALSCRYIRPFSQAALFKSICFRRDKDELAPQFFRENTALAAYVQQVECKYRGSKIAQWIPHLFINLRNLVLYADACPTLPVEIRCQHTLKKLKITNSSIAYTSFMFQSTTYSALTSLEIHWSSRAPVHCQQWIPLLNNTPAIKELKLCGVPLSDNQLDQLHQTLPRLKSLTLGITALLDNEEDQDMTATATQPPVANCLESFHLAVFSSDLELYFQVIEGLEAIILKYINYIYRNYHHLTSLTFYFQPYDVYEDLTILGQIPYNSNLVQQLMREIIYRQKKNLCLLEAELFPYTEMNVAACEKHQIKNISIWDIHMDIETQMMHLHNSTLVNSINKIHMYLEDDREVYQDANVFKRMLVEHQWMHLTKLEINMASKVERTLKYMLPLCLLQYLPNLESLAVDHIEIRDQDMPTLNQTRLKSFQIYLIAGGNLQMANKFFGILLSACPLLEYLELVLNLVLVLQGTDNRACLLLDMKKHCKRLKRFDFFSHNLRTIFLLNNNGSEKPQRYWSSLTKERSAPTDNEQYNMIDLRWNQNTEVKMQVPHN